MTNPFSLNTELKFPFTAAPVILGSHAQRGSEDTLCSSEPALCSSEPAAWRVHVCEELQDWGTAFQNAFSNPFSPVFLDPVSFHHNMAIPYHFEPIHNKVNRINANTGNKGLWLLVENMV